jgi:hypothetical protein
MSAFLGSLEMPSIALDFLTSNTISEPLRVPPGFDNLKAKVKIPS